jgi:predicted PurR-regulated permease PerM
MHSNNRDNWSREKQFWLISGVIFLTLLYLLAPILTPFLIAGFLAYLGDPLVDRLETWKLSRTVSVLVVFVTIMLGLLLFFLLLIPILESQFKKLVTMLPNYLDWLSNSVAPYLSERFGVDPSVLEVDRLKNVISSHWQETGGVIRNAVQTISKSSVMIFEWVTNLLLVPIIAFYLLRDWDHIVAYIDDLLPRSIQPTCAQIASEADGVLGAFLRGQLTVMLALSVLYAAGLSIVGVDFALLIGLIAGLVSFVPYLGLIVGVIIATIAVLFQSHDFTQVLSVLGVFGLVQVLEGTILTPLLVGDKIGLHPVTVIFAVMAGGQLFGFFGILVALPVAAVLAVIMRHIRASYKQS